MVLRYGYLFYRNLYMITNYCFRTKRLIMSSLLLEVKQLQQLHLQGLQASLQMLLVQHLLRLRRASLRVEKDEDVDVELDE